jgi:arginine/lysine/ornithine decarboxylase
VAPLPPPITYTASTAGCDLSACRTASAIVWSKPSVIIHGTHPVWVRPHFDSQHTIAHPPEPDDVRRALEQNPDAKGMLLITPTDWGTCADIRGIAEVCHEFDVPLVVDEAWGAHRPSTTTCRNGA